MSDIQRYAPWPQEWPQEDPNGDLVEYEDHKKIVDALKASAETAEAEVEKLREVERAARKLEENLGVEGVNVGSLRVDLYRALAALKGDDREGCGE